MSNKRFLFIYLCSVFIATASGTCYWINGAEAPDRFTCSDPNTVGASMCCAKESSMFFDSCTDGICAYTYASGALGPYDDGLSFWRDSCTDHTWRNPACVTIDSRENSGENRTFMNIALICMFLDANGSQVRLSKCADGSFCPRNTSDPNTICCDNHLGQFARNASVKLSAGSTSTTLNPTAATSTFFSHSSPSSSTEDSKVATSTSLLQSAPSSGTPESESETSRSLPQNSQGPYLILSVNSSISLLISLVFS